MIFAYADRCCTVLLEIYASLCLNCFIGEEAYVKAGECFNN